MIEVISITLVIIGALIGAGFASGQEIFSFFYIYGKNGIYGILIMSILIGIFIYKSLKIIYQKQVYNYNDFLNLFIKNTKIRNVILWIVNVLLLVSFYIMVAGFGAYFEQEIGINRIIGSIVLNLLCVIVFFSNIKGVLKASNLIVPFLIFFIFFIGIKNIVQIRTIDFYQMKNNWILSMLIYNSYNFILLMPVLISLKKQITKEKNISNNYYINSINKYIFPIIKCKYKRN